MTEYKCGSAESCKYGDMCKPKYDIGGCSHYKAEEPMTNEQWLKSLDTEGLVDYLFEVHKGGNGVERQRWIENHKERVKMKFRGWLKQPHTEKE